MNTDRCIVTDDDILTLLKTENIDSWERLLERTGYTNMEYLKRRVRGMQDKGLIIIGKDKSCLNILFKDREKTYIKALETYGAELQINMVFEEIAELQKELCKYLRKKDTRNKIELIPSIAEEIADVEIMLEQMKLLFEIESAVEKFKTMKVDRLKERLK